MKKTTKLAAAAIAFAGLLFAGSTKAQTTGHDSNAWRFGIGVEGGIPTGDLHDYSHFALGGSARLQKDLTGSVSVMLTSGYTNFFGRKIADNSDVKYADYGIVPVKLGVKGFLAPHFYLSGEAGAGFETKGEDKQTKLILSPGLGYATNSGIDIGIRYDNYSGQSTNFGQVALRLAYGFKL